MASVRFLGILTAAIAAAGWGGDLCAQVRADPTRPAAAQIAWGMARIRNLDFVDLRDVAEKFGAQATWDAPKQKLMLSTGENQQIVFEADGRDCFLNGVRIFLSERVTAHRGSLWVSRLDLIKTIAPLLRPAEQALQLPMPPRRIVLDAGHGGTDPGKSNAKHQLAEKDMTLDVALRLQKLLEARGYRVLLTRKDDTRFANNPLIDLQRRADFSNQAVADLFLSIHFNAVDPKDAARVMGSETYVLTPQSMLSTSDDKKDAMTDVTFPGNRNDLANVILGYHLHRQIVTGLKTSDRGYKRARFAVLRFLDCPAALIEAAYLSNDAEAARVATPEFRQRIAEAIARGVDSYTAAVAAMRPVVSN